MVLASRDIPLSFRRARRAAPPVDGGLLVNHAAAPAVALGAEEIVACGDRAGRPEPAFRHFGRAVERTVVSFLEERLQPFDRKLLSSRTG